METIDMEAARRKLTRAMSYATTVQSLGVLLINVMTIRKINRICSKA